jgi:hypothetical protein
MKRLVGNQNEMNYKVLYESAMRRIAKLEQELIETKAKLEMETTRADAMYDCWQYTKEDLSKANQKAQLFDFLLCDTMVAYYSGEEVVSFQEIINEHRALIGGETTGYVYTSDKEDQAKLLAGYKLIEVDED